MDLPDWVDQLWGELRFKELIGRETGEGFQRLFQQVMKAVDGDDFLDVRPVGKYGDHQCDGWEMHSRTCYAVYGPFTRKSPDQVRRKIARDLHGVVRAWPEMRKWRLVHNDHAGLNAAGRGCPRTATRGIEHWSAAPDDVAAVGPKRPVVATTAGTGRGEGVGAWSSCVAPES